MLINCKSNDYGLSFHFLAFHFFKFLLKRLKQAANAIFWHISRHFSKKVVIKKFLQKNRAPKAVGKRLWCMY